MIEKFKRLKIIKNSKCPICGARERFVVRVLDVFLGKETLGNVFRDRLRYDCYSTYHRCSYAISLESGELETAEFSFDTPLFYNDWYFWQVGEQVSFLFYGNPVVLPSESRKINDIYLLIKKFQKMKSFL